MEREEAVTILFAQIRRLEAKASENHAFESMLIIGNK